MQGESCFPSCAAAEGAARRGGCQPCPPHVARAAWALAVSSATTIQIVTADHEGTVASWHCSHRHLGEMPEVPTMNVPMQQKCSISPLWSQVHGPADTCCLRAWLQQPFYSTSMFLESEFPASLCSLLNTSSPPYVFDLVQKVSFIFTSPQGRWVAPPGAEQVLCPVHGGVEAALGGAGFLSVIPTSCQLFGVKRFGS